MTETQEIMGNQRSKHIIHLFDCNDEHAQKFKHSALNSDLKWNNIIIKIQTFVRN